jgi:hypothetical protein
MLDLSEKANRTQYNQYRGIIIFPAPNVNSKIKIFIGVFIMKFTFNEWKKIYHALEVARNQYEKHMLDSKPNSEI